MSFYFPGSNALDEIGEIIHYMTGADINRSIIANFMPRSTVLYGTNEIYHIGEGGHEKNRGEGLQVDEKTIILTTDMMARLIADSPIDDIV